MTADDMLRYSIPGANSVTLNDALAKRIKKHFAGERENRFQVFLLAAGIRKRYLSKNGEKEQYDDAFRDWYRKNEMGKLFGQLPNFTRYALSGEVVAHVAKNVNNPQRYLDQLPLSRSALYAVSQLLQRDKDMIDVCLKTHPTRRSLNEARSDWGSNGEGPLIHPHATQSDIENFIERWFNPGPAAKSSPVQKKDMVLLARVYVSKDLFRFDERTGKHLGGIDLPDVQEILSSLQGSLSKTEGIALEEQSEKIKKQYYRTLRRSGPTRKIKSKPSQRIVKGKKKTTAKAVQK